MRIPSSTIVMVLVAAVPFGLAIHDTVTHRDRPNDLEAVPAELAVQQSVAQGVSEQELADRIAARDRLREQHARALIGTAFVTPGPIFEGVALGRIDPVAAARFTGRIEVDATGAPLAIDHDLADDDPGCSTLAAVAARTWGEPAHDHVWLDLATHHRASIDPSCGLELAMFQDAADWVAALPLTAIGAPKSALEQRYGVTPDESWLAAGLDGDRLTTIERVFAVANRSRTIGLAIDTTATKATAQRVPSLLAERLRAKPTSDPAEPGVYRWKEPVPIRLEIHADELAIAIGSIAR